MTMKKFVLTIAISVLSIGFLFAQTERKSRIIDTLTSDQIGTVDITATNDVSAADVNVTDSVITVYLSASNEVTTVDLDVSDSTTTVYLVASETIIGKSMIVKNTAATVVLAADSCMNIVCWNDDADVIDYTLPAASIGLVRAFGDAAGGAITIDPFDGVDYIILNGVNTGVGSEIISDGVAGRYIVLMALDDTRWISLPTVGWADNE
jgi:hypothetical protein